MSLTAQDLWDVAEMFSSTGMYPKTESVVLSAIAKAEKRIARELWGERADDGVILLAAHILYANHLINNTPAMGSSSNTSAGATAGPIQSMNVGPLSVSYGASAGVTSASGEDAFRNDVLGTTPWGKQFIEMRSELMLRGAW
jgi:hypothetical protein